MESLLSQTTLYLSVQVPIRLQKQFHKYSTNPHVVIIDTNLDILLPMQTINARKHLNTTYISRWFHTQMEQNHLWKKIVIGWLALWQLG